MHLVLIRFSSLGDIVIQTPLISWIKMNFPQVKITFITSKEFSSLVENHPHIDEVIFYERKKGMEDIKSLWSLAKKIENEIKPDFIVDLHHTLRAKLIKSFCFSIPSLTVDKRSLRRSILIKLKIDLLKNLESHHERVINDFKGIFNREYDRSELENYISKQTGLGKSLSSIPQSFEDQKSNTEGKYIVISPVASFAPKRWPIENFESLIEMVLDDPELKEYKIKLVAGPSDDYCQQINSDKIKAFTGEGRFLNLQGKTTLAQTNEILANTTLCISNDTGMGHISEAFGNPVISIFGPTSESFGFKPHLKQSKVMSLPLWCRPCSATGKSKCFRGKQYCMVDIKPASVYSEVKEFLLRV